MANEYPHTLKFLRTYGNQVEQEIETRLHNLGKVASGELYESIGYRIKETKSAFTLTFKMAAHGEYVDKGSRPSKYYGKPGGSGKSPFIKSLMKWCEIKGLPKNAAFPIRQKIWRDGQAPTNFFTIPTTRRLAQFRRGLKKAQGLDIERALVVEIQNTAGAKVISLNGKTTIKFKDK